jgi:aminoglycoside phosphotransferase (APT) family kinase protein
MNHALRTAMRWALGRRVRRIGEDDAAAYLRAAAVPALGLNGAGSFARVASGANTAVIRWDAGEAGVFFARLWPWRQKTRPVVQHRTAAAMLREAGLATPDILFEDDTLATARRWGVEAVVERSAPGRPLSGIPHEEETDWAGTLADELARVHARPGATWGRPWLPGGARRPLPYWEGRIGKFRRRITPETSGLEAGEIEKALGELGSGLRSQAGRPPMLIHGDVSPAHLFADGAGGLVWIDFETVEYGAPEWDLATVGMWVRDRQFEIFMERYERAAGRRVDAETLRVFTLLMQWERLNSRVQRRRKLLERGEAEVRLLERVEYDRRSAEQAIRVLSGLA